MKSFIYASRNLKEILRDPLNLIFTLGLPLFLLLFMTSLNKNLGVNDAFNVENFAPSTIIFSFSFLSLSSGMLIAKDRTSSFLMRMYSSPMKASDYIIGYTLPIIIIAFIQSIILFGVSLFLGLTISIHIFIAILFLMPIAILFIGIGLLLGSVFNDKQVGGIASIIIQIVAFTSGMWFSLDLIGGAYKTVSTILPFSHAVDIIRLVMSNDYNGIYIHLVWLLGYILVVYISSIIIFNKKMKQ